MNTGTGSGMAGLGSGGRSWPSTTSVPASGKRIQREMAELNTDRPTSWLLCWPQRRQSLPLGCYSDRSPWFDLHLSLLFITCILFILFYFLPFLMFILVMEKIFLFPLYCYCYLLYTYLCFLGTCNLLMKLNSCEISWIWTFCYWSLLYRVGD